MSKHDEQAELIYLAPSPFSHRARWALDAAGAQYSTSPYPQSPFYVAELPLRWRVGNLTGKLTAPILITTVDRHTLQVIMDSTGIARWADKHGDSSRSDSARLFPKGEEAEVDRWVQATDHASSWVRRGFANVAVNNPAVAAALLPPGTSGLAGLIGRNMLWMTFKKVGNKYGTEDSQADKEKVFSDMRKAQQQITSNPNKLLLASSTAPSYADIALATVFNFLARFNKMPVAAAGRGADDGVQQSVANAIPEFQLLLSEFNDLVEWSAELAKQHWSAASEVYKT